MRVVWTEEARDCLRQIRAYIAEDSPKAAEEMVNRLIRRGDQLDLAPARGRRVPEYPEAELRELLERPYRIIYRQLDDCVEIVSVMHYRRLLPERPEDLGEG